MNQEMKNKKSRKMQNNTETKEDLENSLTLL